MPKSNLREPETAASTQDKLDALIAERSRFAERRDGIAGAITLLEQQVEALKRDLAGGDPAAMARGRALRNEAADKQLELESVGLVLSETQRDIDALAVQRQSEVARENLEQKLRVVRALEEQIIGAIGDAMSAGKTSCGAARQVAAIALQLRSGELSGHVDWNRIRAAHAKGFDDLLASHGPIEKFSLPVWLFSRFVF